MTNDDSANPTGDKQSIARAGLPRAIIACVLLWIIGIAVWAIFAIPYGFLLGWIGGTLAVLLIQTRKAYCSKCASGK